LDGTKNKNGVATAPWKKKQLHVEKQILWDRKGIK
jgi:hypothetical protein